MNGIFSGLPQPSVVKCKKCGCAITCRAIELQTEHAEPDKSDPVPQHPVIVSCSCCWTAFRYSPTEIFKGQPAPSSTCFERRRTETGNRGGSPNSNNEGALIIIRRRRRRKSRIPRFSSLLPFIVERRCGAKVRGRKWSCKSWRAIRGSRHLFVCTTPNIRVCAAWSALPLSITHPSALLCGPLVQRMFQEDKNVQPTKTAPYSPSQTARLTLLFRPELRFLQRTSESTRASHKR